MVCIFRLHFAAPPRLRPGIIQLQRQDRRSMSPISAICRGPAALSVRATTAWVIQAPITALTQQSSLVRRAPHWPPLVPSGTTQPARHVKSLRQDPPPPPLQPPASRLCLFPSSHRPLELCRITRSCSHGTNVLTDPTVHPGLSLPQTEVPRRYHSSPLPTLALHLSLTETWALSPHPRPAC